MFNPEIIICSRKKSTRIPDKAFKKINGLSAINHILMRVQELNLPTTILCPPEEVEEYKQQTAIFNFHNVYGGNPESPLHRMADYLVSDVCTATHVIRITNDDLIIDAETIRFMLEGARTGAEYITSGEIVEGAGVEIISREVILKAAQRTEEPQEFLTYCLPEGIRRLQCVPRPAIRRDYRLTMDFIEDAVLIETVLRQVGNTASVDEICKFIDEHKELLSINRLPELSIYTCVFNGEKHIDKTIESALSLSAAKIDYELVIVDDKSCDGTLLKLAKYLHDPRVRIVYNNENIGLAASSNVAINASRGRYVMRLDADDILLPENFSLSWPGIKKMLEIHKAVYPAFYETDEEGELLSGNLSMPNTDHHAGCAVMSRKFANELRFRDSLRNWDGLELYSRILDHGTVGYYGIPTWIYRKRKTSMSNTNKEERARIFCVISDTLAKFKK